MTINNVSNPSMSGQGFNQQLVTIASIDDEGQVTCLNRYGAYLPLVNNQNILGSGSYPQVGEVWLVNKVSGGYTFMSKVQANPPTATDLSSTIQGLVSLGFLNEASSAQSVTVDLTGTPGRYVGATNGAPTYADPEIGDVANDPTNNCIWQYTTSEVWLPTGATYACQYYRSIAWTAASAVIAAPRAFGYDTANYDTHGMYNNPNGGMFTAPVAGLWSFDQVIAATSTAASQYFAASLYHGGTYGTTMSGGAPYEGDSGYVSAGAGEVIQASCHLELRLNVGDTITTCYRGTVVGTGDVGVTATRFAAHFIGSVV